MWYAFWMTCPLQSFVHKGWWTRMSHSDPASIPTGGGGQNYATKCQPVGKVGRFCFSPCFWGKGKCMEMSFFEISILFLLSSLPPVTNAKWLLSPLRKFCFRMRLRPRTRLSWVSFTHCCVVSPGFLSGKICKHNNNMEAVAWINSCLKWD